MDGFFGLVADICNGAKGALQIGNRLYVWHMKLLTWNHMYNSMLSVVEGGGPMRGGFGRVRVCIRKRVYLASVIWGDLVKAAELRK